jgi:hypothetical protein
MGQLSKGRGYGSIGTPDPKGLLPKSVEDDRGDDREPEKGREDAFCAWFHDLKTGHNDQTRGITLSDDPPDPVTAG